MFIHWFQRLLMFTMVQFFEVVADIRELAQELENELEQFPDSVVFEPAE